MQHSDRRAQARRDRKEVNPQVFDAGESDQLRGWVGQEASQATATWLTGLSSANLQLLSLTAAKAVHGRQKPLIRP